MKHVLCELADFVDARTDWIIERWLRSVDRHPAIESEENLNRQQLVDHLPSLCRDLAERVRSAGQADHGEERQHAQEHGTHRSYQGYSLEEVIREAGIVRRVVSVDLLDEFRAHEARITGTAETMAREVIEQFFTEMLAESAQQFTAERRKALRASEQHAQAILDSALDCVVVMGQDGLVRQWNPAAERVFGYKRDDAVGKELARLIIPLELRERHRLGLEKFLATGEGPLLGRRVEINALRADGSKIIVELSIAPYLVEGSWAFAAYLRDITARKANEQARQRLAALVQSSTDAIIAMELDGRIMSWNEGAQRLYGYTADEVIGQPVTMIIPPERHGEEAELLQRIARGEPMHYAETVRLTKDAKLLEVSVSASPIRDDDGRVVGASKIARDITEKKRAERASRLLLAVNEELSRLGTAEEMMRAAAAQIGEFFQVSHCAFVEFDEQANSATVVYDWRRQAEAPAYVGVYQLNDYMSGELRSSLRAGLTIAVNDVASDPRTADAVGNYRALGIGSYLNTPFVSHGALKAALVIYRPGPYEWRQDETDLMCELTARIWTGIERARAEEALAETSERFQTLADNITPLAWMANPDGWIFFYNKRWFEYTGTTLEEMQGWGWNKVHHPEHLERVTEKWRRHLERGEPWEDTFPLRGKDGQYRWFLSRASPIRDEQGRIVRWFGSNTDIDDQKRTEAALRLAQQQAEAANQAKDRFLAALSHELRTPLNPVLMWACAALEHEALDPAVREGLQMICRNVELEARLIDDLLDLTRIARGKLQLKRELCDVRRLVQHTIEIVRSQLAAKQLRLAVDFCSASHAVEADATRLEQVFWNLLKNACKFTPTGGGIAIRTYEPRGGVLAVEVSDTGPGIDSEVLPRLFNAFEQAPGSGEGLGLGLAISRGIVEMHGSKLSARNQTATSGAVFTVELSTVAVTATERGTAQPAQTAPGRKLRILVVEDHAETATTMCKLLQRSGHEPIVATTVREALDVLRQTKLDVLVSDLGLPDGNGMQVMRELSRISETKGIAISGYGMDEDVERSLAAGFSAHLTKPVSLQQLTKAIREVSTIAR